jgi:hypothetical protein
MNPLDSVVLLFVGIFKGSVLFMGLNSEYNVHCEDISHMF